MPHCPRAEAGPPRPAASGADLNLSGAIDFGDSHIGDLTVVLKYVLSGDREGNNLISTGLVVTVPTVSACGETIEGEIHPTLLQPWLGLLWSPSRNLYVHGFSALVVPVDDRDVMFLSNDLGVGYWLYRSNQPACISGVAPTAEVHITTPLNHRGITPGPIGMSDQVIVTGGLNLVMHRACLLTLGAAVPITGPRPFDIEGVVQFNWRF